MLGPQLAKLGDAADCDMTTNKMQLRLQVLADAYLNFVITKLQMEIVVQDLVPLGFQRQVRIHNLITNLEATKIRRLGGFS